MVFNKSILVPSLTVQGRQTSNYAGRGFTVQLIVYDVVFTRCARGSVIIKNYILTASGCWA